MGMGAIAPMVPTTHPRKQITTGTAKDLSSPESRDCRATSGTATNTAKRPATRYITGGCPTSAVPLSTMNSPTIHVPASRIICINATGIMITTILHKMSDNALLVLVRRRFQFVPWCSILQAAAASNPTPMDK